MNVGKTRLAVLSLLGAVCAALGLVALPASAGAASTGEVCIIHGIDGVTLDVIVDGEQVAAGAQPKSVTGPLKLSVGSHSVAFMDGSKTVAEGKFTVRAGSKIDVVAHRNADASMAPVITVFRNKLDPVGPGKTRLVVAHVAAAPPADVKVNGKTLFSNIANGESLTLLVPAKTYTIEVVPSATGGAPILGPLDVRLKAGTLTRIYAIGDVSKDTMDAIIHVHDVPTSGAARPRLVVTGTGGQAAGSFIGGSGSTLPVLAAGLAGGLAIGTLALASLGRAARRAARKRIVR